MIALLLKFVGMLAVLFLIVVIFAGCIAILPIPKQKTAEKQAAQPIQTQQQTQTSKQVSSADAPKPDFKGAAVLGDLLTQTFRKNGNDVIVYDLDPHTLLFDCSKELNPRESCYLLYKTYPKNRAEAEVLKTMFGVTR
jgi:hypothetical protein